MSEDNAFASHEVRSLPDGSVCMPFLSSNNASKSEEEPETLVTKTSIIQHIISMASIEAKFESELKEKKNTKRCFLRGIKESCKRHCQFLGKEQLWNGRRERRGRAGKKE